MKDSKARLSDSEKGKAILNPITIKKVKEGFGHDLNGYYCDFYFENKKVGYVNDDGWGGEEDIHYFSDELKEKMVQFFKEHKLQELMFDDGWEFMKSPDKITFESQLVFIIEHLLEENQMNKIIKKRDNKAKKAIVYGDSEGYRAIGWNIPLKDVVGKHPHGLKRLQHEYDKVKANLKKGETILNTNLAELGVKL